MSNLAQAANLRAANAFDPFNMASSTNTGSNQQLFGQGSGFSSGAYGNQYVQNEFNPFQPYAQDVYGSNMNAANARAISAQNNAAALQGANTANSGAIANSFLRLLGGLYS